MKRILHLLLISTKREILQWLAWRSFLLTMIVNQAVTPLLGLIVWSVALPGIGQITTYYVALLIVQLMTVSYEYHTFSAGIYRGTLSQELLKPQPVVLGPLGTNLALRIWHLLFGLPIIIFVGIISKTVVDLRMVLLAFPALLLAATLRFLFTYLLALSAFWSQKADNIVGFGETLLFLLGGSAAPIILFPSALRPLAEALPFRAMLGFPAEMISSSLNSAQILTAYSWQVLWTLMFLLVVVFVERSGLRHYIAIGG
ncbi:ABC transporter permease [Dictyobacter sp. S3.2.2.5]|uniref:ABC transporter permease n=1 Tax=Dictyobacter halimunensis TaxID=3026934 RepID=A0ABQ6FQC6_9CHLR|nr:ABC transporter permease [Dictyobacter sp. S3.2.2.5]